MSPGSVTSKWPWSKHSPITPDSDSTLAAQRNGNPRGKSSIERPSNIPRDSTESSGSRPGVLTADAPFPVSQTSGLDQKSLKGPNSTTSFSLDADKATAQLITEHEGLQSEPRNSPKGDTIAISEITLTVAVDCSSSTRGRVLEAEKNAIRRISGLLSREAQQRVVVLPWNDEAESVLALDEMDDLFGAGGTDPTTLIRDRHHRQALLNSSLWVLLTDGEIDEYLIKDFAMGIGNVGLHGTASIVVCAGHATKTPALCNISVGKSVFAVAPDCMFVFHDVPTEKVYILQCKGRFKALLPSTKQNIVLDQGTTWEELPQISYEDLRDFDVPERRELSCDTVLLTSGKTFDLNDVYKDILDASITNEILSNDDDLKTLLLTAATRGRKEDVKKWISKKKLQISDLMWMPRPDLGQRSCQTVEKLIEAMRNSNTSDITNLKRNLQSAHEANWNKFTTIISTEKENARIREVVIADATARLKLEDNPLTPPSPVLLGPVSPMLTETSYSLPQPTPTEDYPERRYHRNRSPSRCVDIRLSGSRNPYRAVPPRPSLDVIFTQGYKCKVRETDPGFSSSSEYFEGNCTMCNRTAQVMALILRKPEDDELTANYPQPQQDAKHKFPFVLGNFPDVDITSSEIYCETCSVYLVRHGRSPKADCILGALPLVRTQGKDYGINLKSWTETLTKVFEGRFHESITLSVFLSVLYNTLDDLMAVDSSENTILIRAIRWTCRNLLQAIQVFRDTTSVPLGESPLADDGSSSPPRSSAPLGEIIPQLVGNALRGHGPLLTYPLDGFLILIFAARDIDNENCKRESLRCVVWLRIAFHIAEEHYTSMLKDGNEKARSNLFQLLHARHPEAKPGTSSQEMLLRKSPITLASLENTHLLSSDDLETFRRTGTLFTHISSKCGAASAVYLHYLLEFSQMYSNAIECFEALRKEKALRKVFVAPEEVNLGQAVDIISRLQTTLKNMNGTQPLLNSSSQSSQSSQ